MVFEWLVDRDKQQLWMGDTIEWLPRDRADLRVGYRGAEVMQTPGGPTEATVEITAYDPPHELAARHEHSLFAAQSRFRLEAVQGGTEVESSTRIRYRSLRIWLQVLPVAGFYGRVVKSSLEQFKQLVEDGAH